MVQVLTPSGGAYDSVLYVAGTDDDATDRAVLGLLDAQYPWIGVNSYGATPQ